MSTFSKERIDLYKKIDKFLEDHRTKEKEDKNFFKDMMVSSFVKDYQSINCIDDKVAHWICKMVFNDADQGYFVMNEGFIFTVRLYK